MAKTTSLFSQYVDKWMEALVLSVTNTINGEKGDTPVYLHLSWLTTDYTPTLKWEALSGNGTTVAADVVSLDSELPLKSRDSLGSVNGDVPKIGMKMYLKESELQKIDIMRSMNRPESDIVARIFNDLQRCIYGVHERLEYMLLEALSSGVTTIQPEGDDRNNIGRGIRIDFGIPNANRFDVDALWSDVTSKPLDDFDKVLEKAEEDGNVITSVKMDKVTFNNFKKTTQVKEKYAFSVGFVGSQIPTPDLEKVNTFLLSDYGFTIEVINRSVSVEINGVKTSKKPWVTGMVSFVTTNNIGRLVYGDLAEQNHPVAGVTYATASTFILTSKFSQNEPLQEWSSAMANVIPVLDNASAIYLLNTLEVETVTS